MSLKNLVTSSIGQLRILGFLEGISFVLLIFIAMPMKYLFDSPWLVKQVGMAHGLLFVAFVVYTVIVSFDQKWGFWKITSKLLLSSIVPFGPFYAEAKILKPLHQSESNNPS